MNIKPLKSTDPDIYEAIKQETEREKNKLVLIASENYSSMAVLEAQGSILTNKYAEGYPGKRYYGGCEYADVVESLAISRAKELFGAEHVNVQPHSGTQANMAVYLSVLKPRDRVLGMNLSHGGHLSHGSKVNFSGSLYKSFFYGVGKKTGLIDYDEIRRLAKRHKPKLLIAGASAYSRIIDFKVLSEIAKEADAYFLADIAHIAGLVATGLHPSPFPYADFVTTTTHKTLRGPRGGMIMCRAEFGRAIDKMVFPGIQGGPLVHVIAAKAVALKEALSPSFGNYQLQVLKNSKELADALMHKGFRIISGGTDTHLMLIDLTNKGITGIDAETALDKAGITLNKNSIPFEKRSASVTSGIRVGTPIVTSRGMKEPEMVVIANLISSVINNIESVDTIDRVRNRVRALCKEFSVYEEME
jgi:glycine hydroxymethyltransferase